jgi:nitrate reductase NapAB chaperone NapD
MNLPLEYILNKPVVFIDTDGLGNGLEDIGPITHVESVITAKLALALSAAGLDESSIGILSKPVVFIDTDGLGNGLEDIGPITRVESVITAKLGLALSAAGLDESSIGIITPF